MKNLTTFISQNILIIVLIIGVVAAVNFISNQYPTRWDLTDEKEYTLSESSIKVLDRLEDRLTFKLYFSNDLPPVLLPIAEQINDLLTEFQAHSKQKVVIENIVPDLNEDVERETLAAGFRPLEINIPEKDKLEVRKLYMGMAIYYKDQRQVLPAVVQLKDLEYVIDQNILKMTQKELPKVGVMIGSHHNKYQLIPQIVKQVAELEVIKPDDTEIIDKKLTSLLVIDPVELPKTFTEELDKLLESGVNVMVFSGYTNVGDDMVPLQVETGLGDWLGDRGITVIDKLLLDTKQNMQAGFNSGYMQVYLPYHFWVRALKQDLNNENPVTSRLEEVVFPWSNVLEYDESLKSKWNYQELAKSSQFSFLQNEETPTVNPQYVNDMQSLPVMESHRLSTVVTNSENEKYGELFVTATHHVLQDQFLQRSQSNVMFLANMIEYSSWGDFLIGIRSRGNTTRPIQELSSGAKSLVKWSHMVAIPLLSIIIGLIVLSIHKSRRAKLIKEVTA